MTNMTLQPAITMLPSPENSDWTTQALARAIEDAGASHVAPDAQPHGLIVGWGADTEELLRVLNETPSIQWVQLPFAGIESYKSSLTAHPDLTWTSAKGIYGPPVGEHALALTLALLRDLPERVRATSWGASSGITLNGARAVVVGAGGVAQESIRLLKAFDTHVTAVRRSTQPVPGADLTVTTPQLREALPEADVVVLAAALTEETRNLIGEAELALMKETAVLVNVGRGGLVNTDALTTALASGAIKGAGLDVTEPEPLPDSHPLWSEPRCIITPHTADTLEICVPLYVARIRKNIAALTERLNGAGSEEGAEIEGLVDARAGY